jgi:phage-related protein (TIGR01555 family)
MFKKIKAFFNWDQMPPPIIDVPTPKTAPPRPMKKKPMTIFTTDLFTRVMSRKKEEEKRQALLSNVFNREAKDFVAVDGVMDSASQYNLKTQYSAYNIPMAQLSYYSSHSFIGYQMCALIAQHWLVDKACSMPARDAIRKGYEITSNDGTEITLEIKEAMRKADIKYRLNDHLVQFVRKGRIFGIRIAMFDIRSNDPDFYEKPFNIDGVAPGSYRGIVQIDPQWISPELDVESASNPVSLNFYEPTWWRVNNLRIHRSHLIIMRTDEVVDLLKPTYFYGGVPIPQKIFERIYAAERTANEAPQLALTKRSIALHVDAKAALAQQAAFEQKIESWSYFMNNWGVKVLDKDEKLEQFDTSLADLDAVIMTQYQLVAAAANVPAVKLLGTSPKGFNATGAFEEASYHEELESIQTHDLTPLIERHHLLLIKSEIAPKFNMAPFSTEVKWRPLNSVTDKEQAEINYLKSQTSALLIQNGAIDAEDERQRLIADPNSGYSGMSAEMPEPDDEQDYDDEEETAQEF